MTMVLTRAPRAGETWTHLGNGRVMITHPDRQVITLDVDSVLTNDGLTFQGQSIWADALLTNADPLLVAPKL